MIGKENGAAVSSRISNIRRRSASAGTDFVTKRPLLQTEIKIVEENLNERRGTSEKTTTADTKKWKKTTNSFEMSVLKKQKQAKKEVR